MLMSEVALYRGTTLTKKCGFLWGSSLLGRGGGGRTERAFGYEWHTRAYAKSFDDTDSAFGFWVWETDLNWIIYYLLFVN